mgnify:CR=1 FL=1
MRSRRLLPIVALAAIAIAARRLVGERWRPRTQRPRAATRFLRATRSPPAARAARNVGESAPSRRTEATSPTGAIPLPLSSCAARCSRIVGNRSRGRSRRSRSRTTKRKLGFAAPRPIGRGAFGSLGWGGGAITWRSRQPWGPRRVRDDADTWESRLGDYDFGVVEIPEEAALRGRVVDESGRPVARARIFAFPRDVFTAFEQGDRRAYEPRTTTDADGRFSILGIDGEEIAVGTDAEGFGPRVDFFVCAEPRPEVRITLAKANHALDERRRRARSRRSLVFESRRRSPARSERPTKPTRAASQHCVSTATSMRSASRSRKRATRSVESNGLKGRYVLHAIPSIRVRWDDHPAGRVGVSRSVCGRAKPRIGRRG